MEYVNRVKYVVAWFAKSIFHEYLYHSMQSQLLYLISDVQNFVVLTVVVNDIYFITNREYLIDPYKNHLWQISSSSVFVGLNHGIVGKRICDRTIFK